MYIFEEMKVNKFKLVRIPSKGEYFNTGRYIAEKGGMYGGEEGEGVDAIGTDKLSDTEALMVELDRQQTNDKD